MNPNLPHESMGSKAETESFPNRTGACVSFDRTAEIFMGEGSPTHSPVRSLRGRVGWGGGGP